MPYDDPNTIDMVATAGETIILGISAAAEWSTDNEALEKLNSKLQTYARYIFGSEYAEEYEDAPVTVVLISLNPVTNAVENLLKKFTSNTGIATDIQYIDLDSMTLRDPG